MTDKTLSHVIPGTNDRQNFFLHVIPGIGGRYIFATCNIRHNYQLLWKLPDYLCYLFLRLMIYMYIRWVFLTNFKTWFLCKVKDFGIKQFVESKKIFHLDIYILHLDLNVLFLAWWWLWTCYDVWYYLCRREGTVWSARNNIRNNTW